MKLDPVRFIRKSIRKRTYRDGLQDFIIDDDPIDEIGQAISKEAFNGSGAHSFGSIGRLQLITLLKLGVTPDSRVLDVGCGALRAGYWLIHFLKAGNYFGIEPNKEMLAVGKKHLFADGSLEQKKPTFDHNSNFDFSVFNRQFDFYIARSIWTHTSKAQIEQMLDSFVSTRKSNGIFLASYLKPYRSGQDYKGSEWIGLSHESEDRGVVFHSFEWVQEECQKRGLTAEELKFDVAKFQIWIMIR